MSIIHNALKKTQEKLNKKNNQANADKNEEAPPPAQNNQGSKPKDASSIYQKLYNPAEKSNGGNNNENNKKGKGASPKNTRRIMLIVLIVAAITLLVAGIVYIPQMPYFEELKKNAIRNSYRPRMEPAERKYRRGELVLNGTTTMDDRTVALINNAIYELGEVIDEKEIINITLDSVELRDAETGEIEVLKVGR